MDRWRGRRLAGLAAAGLLAALTASAVAATRADDTVWLVVRDRAGSELARAPLPVSGQFALRYRNSAYESVAEEELRVVGDHLELVQLRAEELAVLEEYYTAVGATRSGTAHGLPWRIDVERPPIGLPLRIQATELGRRTLLVGGEEMPLWRLVAGRDDSLVILGVEGHP